LIVTSVFAIRFMRAAAAVLLIGSWVFAADEALAAAADSQGRKTEVGVFPLVGGDSDIGFGGGQLSSVTGYAAGHSSYRWRVETGAFVSFKPPTGSDGWRSPYQDVYFDWVIPEVVRKTIRFEMRPSYTHEASQTYYGIGNASRAPTAGPEGQSASAFYQYDRTHPTLLVRLQVTIGSGLFFLLGNYVTYNRIDVHPGSQLERDATPGSSIARFFGPLAPHLVDVFEYGLIYDTRDNETSPHAGMFHQVKLRLSPGGAGHLPYRYGQASIIARFYATPVPRWLTLGLRVVADGQAGDPPFYELARYEDTFALGGVNGVRGVPGQRYYGEVKLFGNFEIRSELVRFNWSDKDYSLGLVGFFDCGRLWADWRREPTLDGSGVGLKYGAGGGLRFQQGQSFVVRGDLAWSPDARPIGAYVTAGHAF